MSREIVFLGHGDSPERTHYENCDIVIPTSVPPTEYGLLKFLEPLFEGKHKVDFKFCNFCKLGDKCLDKRI